MLLVEILKLPTLREHDEKNVVEVKRTEQNRTEEDRRGKGRISEME